jgi:excinuclease ABC subunit C
MSESPLRQQLEHIPPEPGVYVFKNAAGEAIYVGKAKSLRARVRSYFGVGGDGRQQVPFLMALANSVEVFLTGNEKEALLLENQLIKEFQPSYNVKLKDDKNYLCLRIDTKQKFPRVEITRRMRHDGARYFGPYHSASSIRQTVRLLNRHFVLRTCRDTVFKNRKRPCLQYEIKRCPGPCVFPVEPSEYAEHVHDAMAFLEGRTTELMQRLGQRMHDAAAREEFEQAALHRDQLQAVQSSLEKQRVMAADLEDRDIFGIAREGERVVIQLLWVRSGNMRGGRTFDLDHAELELPELLEDAVRSYYDSVSELPREVLLPVPIEGQDALEQWLRERKAGAVTVLVPERGAKHKLVAMATKNAELRLRTRVETTEAAHQTLERLQRSLRLHNFPERIECYDISNTQGGQIVGSQVVFEEGVPAKAEYRLYKIKLTDAQDDFRSMHEVLTRRLKRGLEEGELPSLIVIDGGIGQLNVARAVFMELGIEGVDLCALAKSRALEEGQGFSGQGSVDKAKKWEALLGGETAGVPDTQDTVPDTMAPASEQPRSPERVFLPGQKNPIVLKPYAQELLLLTHLRDEAHRFAITFHRKLRKKSGLASALDSVVGLGPKRKRALLRHFGSVKAFVEAAPAALNDVPGLPSALLARAQSDLRANSGK